MIQDVDLFSFQSSPPMSKAMCALHCDVHPVPCNAFKLEASQGGGGSTCELSRMASGALEADRPIIEGQGKERIYWKDDGFIVGKIESFVLKIKNNEIHSGKKVFTSFRKKSYLTDM